jgi:sulfur-oxidizing protein SoxY
MSFELTDNVMMPLKTRIKIVAGESQLIAVIRAEGKLYKTTRDVRVYAGGNA